MDQTFQEDKHVFNEEIKIFMAFIPLKLFNEDLLKSRSEKLGNQTSAQGSKRIQV